MDNFFTSNKTSSNYSRTYSKGKSFKFSVWNSKDTYNNDEFVQDFVQWDKTLWAAKKTSINVPPKEGEYWELIVKGVSDIEFRQVDNRIEYRYIDPTSEWKDLFELASVSEDQIRKMLEDLDIKYGNTYDVKLSETSTNAVQNQVVTKKFKELDNKNTKTDSELTNIKSSVNTALSNSKSYTDSKISETKTQIDSELNKKANQTDVNEVVDVLNENINLKVDKVSGKGLSTNDFNDNYKSKLDNLDSSLNSTLTSAKSYTNSEITKVNNKINSEISRAQASETNLSGRINDLEEDLVDALQEAKEYTDSLANGEVKNNTNKINTLSGTGEGSVIKTVKDEISNLVGTAPEKLDTLQEIADYLEEHEDMASGLVNSLSELEAKKADKTELNNLKTETDSALQSLEKSKANTTDYYPQMSVGQADNLPDRGDVLEGFIGFRESAGAGNSIEDGTANVQELLGESLVWNNIAEWRGNGNVYKGLTVTYEGGKVHIQGTPEDTEIVFYSLFWDEAGSVRKFTKNHYYLIRGASEHFELNVYSNVSVVGDNCITQKIGDTMRLNLRGYDLTIGQEVNESFFCQVIDLTQMFGAGKEPSTIEEFEARKNQLVGVDFNAYNAGEVLGVNIKGIKSVNDNAWDEEWEVFGTNAIISKNFNRCISGETYHVRINNADYDGNRFWLGVRWFDKNKNEIQIDYCNDKSVVCPSNACYFKISTNTSMYLYGNTYNHDICIRLAHSGYKTDYVAHEESESSFDLTKYFPNGMHGLNGVRDSATPKKATRRFGVKKLKDLSWKNDNISASLTGIRFESSVIDDIIKSVPNNTIAPIISSKYVARTAVDTYMAIRGIAVKSTGTLSIYDSAYANAESFAASFTDEDILIYELATPIETEIDPQLNMNYKVWDFGTEELLTDSKSAPVLARTIYGFNATDTIRGNKATNEEQDARLHTLESEVVRKGDYSPDNSVGFADDLVGRGESVPAEFSFRASGGKSIKDGTAWIKRLKGNSVVWNQKLIRDNKTTLGITTTWADNIATLSGTATSTYAEIADSRVPVFNEHKYLIEGLVVSNPNSLSFGLGLFNNISGQLLFDSSTAYKAGIFICNGYYRSGFGVNRFGGAGIDLTGLQLKARVIDLTQMFDAGNEPTTIEEFYARKPIVADEYAYNAGEVIHMTAEGIKSVGDNAWDEEWEIGGINYNNGDDVAVTSKCRNRGFVKVLPNEEYYLSSPSFGELSSAVVICYDENKQFMNHIGGGSANARFTIPSDCHYIRFTWVGTTYNHDIMITLVHSGWKQDTDAGYQPYWEDRLIFDQRIKDEFPDGMKKWDMVYNKDGKGYIVKGTGVKKLWELNGWTRGASSLIFIAIIPDMMPSLNINNGIMAEYNLCSSQNGSTMIGNVEDKSYITNGGATGGAGRLAISDSAYNDVDSFVAHLEEVQAKLYYELAEPTIIEYDEPFNLDYKVADFGTEQAIAEQPSAPINADIIYQFNAVDMIREHELEIEELKTTIVNLQTLITQLQTSISSMGGVINEITVTE